MTLLIDNYDSFSYNLYQLIGELDPRIQVIRNDEMTVEEILAMGPDRVILSRPRQAGGRGDPGGGSRAAGEGDPTLRRVPGASGDLPGVWRDRDLCGAADAREAVGGGIRQ